MSFDFSHRLAIVDSLSTVWAFVKFQGRNRIGLTLGLAGPITPDPLDLITAASRADCNFHYCTYLILGAF